MPLIVGIVQAQPDMYRLITRRAFSANPARVEADGYGSMELVGDELRGIGRIDYVIVDCTLSDIGDPRFRLWLVKLSGRISSPLHISLEVHA